jgi:hypothetical protein
MSRRVVVAVAGFVVATGVLATGGLVALIGGGPGRFITPTGSLSRAPVAPLVTSGSATDQRSSGADSPWARISDGSGTKAEYFAALNDPTNSDLAPDVARRLSELGARFLRADLSGEGRGGFGDYWGDGTALMCCRAVVVHAATAERHLGNDDIVDVAVIWSAERVGGGAVAETTTVVHFAARAEDWQPLHPWELP